MEEWEMCKVTKSGLIFSREGQPDLEMDARSYIVSKGGPDKKATTAETIPYLIKDGWKIAGVGPLGCIRLKRIILEVSA